MTGCRQLTSWQGGGNAVVSGDRARDRYSAAGIGEEEPQLVGEHRPVSASRRLDARRVDARPCCVPDGPANFVVGEPASRPGSGRSKILDGTAALAAVIERAGWPTVAGAVAAHALLLDPATVTQTGGRAIVPSVRNMGRRRQLGELPDGRRFLFDDNSSPTDAFLWAANRIKGTDVQFNQVWVCASDPDAYTALWNPCCTPAFLAKATDSERGVQAVLRYRSWELYGHRPVGTAEPVKPSGYETLTWHASPPPIADLEGTFRKRMQAAPGCGLVLAARSIGWAFSCGPDLTV